MHVCISNRPNCFGRSSSTALVHADGDVQICWYVGTNWNLKCTSSKTFDFLKIFECDNNFSRFCRKLFWFQVKMKTSQKFHNIPPFESKAHFPRVIFVLPYTVISFLSGWCSDVLFVLSDLIYRFFNLDKNWFCIVKVSKMANYYKPVEQVLFAGIFVLIKVFFHLLS